MRVRRDASMPSAIPIYFHTLICLCHKAAASGSCNFLISLWYLSLSVSVSGEVSSPSAFVITPSTRWQNLMGFFFSVSVGVQTSRWSTWMLRGVRTREGSIRWNEKGHCKCSSFLSISSICDDCKMAQLITMKLLWEYWMSHIKKMRSWEWQKFCEFCYQTMDFRFSKLTFLMKMPIYGITLHA